MDGAAAFLGYVPHKAYRIAPSSDFQNLARFCAPRAARAIRRLRPIAKARWRLTKLAAKRVREVAVAGKFKIERQPRQVLAPLIDPLEGGAKAKAREIPVYGQARFPAEDSNKVIGRAPDGGRYVRERQRPGVLFRQQEPGLIDESPMRPPSIGANRQRLRALPGVGDVDDFRQQFQTRFVQTEAVGPSGLGDLPNTVQQDRRSR